MITNLDDRIQKDPNLFAAVTRATKLLESGQGESGPLATADWQLDTDVYGQSLVGLRLSLNNSSVAAQLRREEAINSDLLLARLRHLWGDLLEDRSHKQLAKLRQMVAELEEDEVCHPRPTPTSSVT